MKILVTGANGMVGNAVKKVFKEHELILTDIEDLDVRYWSDVKGLKFQNIDLIIHLAAETDLELCERDPAQAYFCNHTGTMNMLAVASINMIPLVYISTAGIFDGKKVEYADEDLPCPINHYGRSKMYGEWEIRRYPKAYILRAGWMYGGGPDIDKKFVNLIINQIKSGKKVIKALDDVYGSPTSAYDLMSTAKNLIEHEKYGTYNCAGQGRASRFDVANAIVASLGYKDDVVVEPVKSGYFEDKFPCPRSKSEVLINYNLDKTGLSCMRPWRIALEEYLCNYYH